MRERCGDLELVFVPTPAKVLPVNISMLRRVSLVALAVFFLNHSATAQNSKSTADEGFKSLFDGSNLDGWKQKGNWAVENGVITRTGRGGSLVYEAAAIPDDFELRFEWKVAEGSNSGVYYRPGQYEYQILDNKKHQDGKNPRTSAASLYFCMQPSHDATKPAGEWNYGRIVCKGTVIQHWLNNEKVVDFDYSNKKYSYNVKMLMARGGDLAARGAKLSLQDHGDPVWYRNIQLKALTDSDQLDKTPVKPEPIRADVLASERKKVEAMLKRKQQQPPRGPAAIGASTIGEIQ